MAAAVTWEAPPPNEWLASVGMIGPQVAQGLALTGFRGAAGSEPGSWLL